MAVTGKETAYLTATGPAGEEIRVPIATVHGAQDGPTLAVIAGVHGSEYDGIEATKRLVEETSPETLRGTLIAVPCLNVPGFYGLAMHVNPVDNENPGRAAPGDPGGSYTQRMMELAWTHAIKDADAVVDVHGGDLEEELVEYSQVELIGDDALDGAAEALARALDMPFFVRREARQAEIGSGGPIPLVAALHGIPAVLAEAGSHGLLDERCVGAHLKGLRNALKHLEMVPGELETENPRPVELRRFVGFPAPVDGFWYPEVLKGDIIAKGQRLGRMCDFFGETLSVVESPENAAILGVMTIPPRRKGDMLMGLGTLD
jgi:predicted deacylase